jgi:hypothetical protein
VSKREFDQIKLLLKVDQNIFAPSELASYSPHNNVINLSKYKDLPKDAKDILYRPPKVKILNEKYWQLVKQVHGKEKEDTDAKYYKNNKARYPKKTTEELQFLDKIF